MIWDIIRNVIVFAVLAYFLRNKIGMPYSKFLILSIIGIISGHYIYEYTNDHLGNWAIIAELFILFAILIVVRAFQTWNKAENQKPN